jgi:hypothetical protein
MEKKLIQKLPEAMQGSYEIEKSKSINNNQKQNLNTEDKEKENNDVGAPPLVIVVQGGRGVNKKIINIKFYIKIKNIIFTLIKIKVRKNNSNPFFSKILYKSKYKSRKGFNYNQKL